MSLTVFVSEALTERRKPVLAKIVLTQKERVKSSSTCHIFSIKCGKKVVNDKSVCVSFNTLTQTTGIPVAFSL